MDLRIVIAAVDMALRIYCWLIVARAIMSWVRPSRYNVYYARFEGFVYDVTEPVLGAIRSRLPAMGIDLSPILAFMLIEVVRRLIITVLYRV